MDHQNTLRQIKCIEFQIILIIIVWYVYIMYSYTCICIYIYIWPLNVFFYVAAVLPVFLGTKPHRFFGSRSFPSTNHISSKCLFNATQPPCWKIFSSIWIISPRVGRRSFPFEMAEIFRKHYSSFQGSILLFWNYHPVFNLQISHICSIFFIHLLYWNCHGWHQPGQEAEDSNSVIECFNDFVSGRREWELSLVHMFKNLHENNVFFKLANSWTMFNYLLKPSLKLTYPLKWMVGIRSRFLLGPGTTYFQGANLL